MADRLTLRARAAASSVRVVNALSRASGRGTGTVAGGRAGLALDPRLLDHLASGRTVIVVSGTNGKTTTTALVAAGWGGSAATNATGANMPAGHVAALVDTASDRVVLEVDEAWLPEVIARTAPRVAVLLNLSRDQLDRTSEVRRMAERWRRCFADRSTSAVAVVANANDPLVVYSAEVAPGVRWCDVPTVWHGDATSCPKCTQPIAFDPSGWRCACGFARPTNMAATLDERLSVHGVVAELALAVPGAFNAANAAQAVTALDVVGVPVADAVARINVVAEVAGRFARRRWRGRALRLVLAKNPAGFAAVLPLVDRAADLWIAINAQVADGRDPSWLYDVPFEELAGRSVACLGERRLDLATRLEYAGVEASVVDDPATLAEGRAPVWLVANYTAFSAWLSASAPA
ncbi:MAG: MurT ligase domain-containing protein [Acidimicrobiales bacterium]